MGQAVDLANVVPTRVVYDEVPAGPCTIELRIDTQDAVAELNEANNRVRLKGVVVLPDLPNLTVEGFLCETDWVAAEGGDPLAFGGRILNTGSRATSAPFWIEYRVRPKNDRDAPWRFLCDSHAIGTGLEAGAAIDLPTLPARTAKALPDGIYIVGIRLDPENTITERREDDNELWLTWGELHVSPRPTAARHWEGLR
jgi:hypothetical protein